MSALIRFLLEQRFLILFLIVTVVLLILIGVGCEGNGSAATGRNHHLLNFGTVRIDARQRRSESQGPCQDRTQERYFLA